MNNRTYAVREHAHGKKGDRSYLITIPIEMGREAVGKRFVPEWHPDGILLRFVDTRAQAKPDWLQADADRNMSTQRRQRHDEAIADLTQQRKENDEWEDEHRYDHDEHDPEEDE